MRMHYASGALMQMKIIIEWHRCAAETWPPCVSLTALVVGWRVYARAAHLTARHRVPCSPATRPSASPMRK
jgi:hypothetical protein